MIDLGQPGIWALRAGQAHVFAVPMDQGEPAAPRRHLFTIDAPGVLFGGADETPDLGFVAVPLPGAVMEPDPGFWSEPSLPAIEQWASGWSTAASRYLLTRKAATVLASADRPTELDAGAIAESSRSVLWLQIEAGAGTLFDTQPPGDSVVPLAPGGWIHAAERLTLRPIAPDALLADGTLRRAVGAFEPCARRQVHAALRLDQSEEQERLERRAGRLSGDLRRVMEDLGRMVGAVPPGSAMPGANQTWFHVAHLVARRIGVRVRMPTAVRGAEARIEVPLADVLAVSGLRSRSVRLPDDWFRQSLGDMVGTDAGSGAPVALLEERGGYLMLDPSAGTRTRISAENAATVSPAAFALYQPLPDTRVTLTQLCNFGMQGTMPDKVVMVVAATLGACASSLPAIGSRFIMQDLIPQHLTGLLIQAGIALGLVAILRAIFSYVGNIAFVRIRMRSSARLKAALWDRVLRQPMAFFSRYTAPDLTLRCNTAEGIVLAVHQLVQQTMVSTAMLVINLATMFWLSRTGGFAALGLIAIYGLAIRLAWWGQKRAFTLGESAEGATSVFVHAVTNGMRKIRLAGAEDRAFVKWAERFSRSRTKLINVRRVTNWFLTFGAGYEVAALAAILAVLAVLRDDDLPIGTLFGFVVAFGTVMQSMSALGRAVTNVAFQFASVPYCQPVLDTIPPKEAQKSSPGRLSGAIEMSNVWFRYNDGDQVLKGISLVVTPGEFVAIVGATGSGKSTLLRLLLGLERPQSGTVLYDQRDLEGLDIDAVRRQIGTVAQRSALMPGTLMDVIRGTSNAGADAVWQAARDAGIAADIDSMPMRMHTLVAEGAPGFSGGQVQRIAIARAIAGRPALLLLDEATSALDNRSQAEVTENLALLSCTRIVVAHRLSTIARADRIIVLQDGQIAEQGGYEELIAAGGVFAMLVQRQAMTAAALERGACLQLSDQWRPS